MPSISFTEWTQTLSSSAEDSAHALTTGSDGAIYISGYTEGDLDGQTNNGGFDTFTTKFSIRENGKFFENRSSDSIIGKLSTVDQSNNANYIYQLVNGSGDDDNDYFELSGDYLILKQTPDYETKSSYKLRIQSTDNSGVSISKNLLCENKNILDYNSNIEIFKKILHCVN